MTLRDSIKEGLGDAWTQELEDKLFWTLAEFSNKCRDRGYEQGHKDGVEVAVKILKGELVYDVARNKLERV